MNDVIRRTGLEAALERFRQGHTASTPCIISLAETRRLAQEFGQSPRQVELAALRVQILPQRYARNLGTVGWEGQCRLLEACVAVIGCGGLGGWIAEGLARMGVGRLILVDGDCFAEDNLNRQLGCTERTLGKPKVAVLVERLAEVNAATEVIGHQVYLTEENGAALLTGANVIVDALDNMPARFTLHRVAAALGLPVVHGAIGGYTGQVMTVLPGDAGLMALYGERDVPERGVEKQLGNPSATPMMISAWQIQEVVKLIVGQGELLRHRMLLLDAESGQVSEVRLD